MKFGESQQIRGPAALISDVTSVPLPLDPRCQRCRYRLTGLCALRCPECGCPLQVGKDHTHPHGPEPVTPRDAGAAGIALLEPLWQQVALAACIGLVHFLVAACTGFAELAAANQQFVLSENARWLIHVWRFPLSLWAESRIGLYGALAHVALSTAWAAIALVAIRYIRSWWQLADS